MYVGVSIYIKLGQNKIVTFQGCIQAFLEGRGWGKSWRFTLGDVAA